MAGGGVPAQGELEPFGLMDFAPTMIKYFGKDIPADMQGGALPVVG
ncbi:MAG: hypothetical protein K8I27_10140 [Planctomycetes bacterium]|nr:hypothetical protein [Planctomycetota bacterium]